jgi:hypothetical protein
MRVGDLSRATRSLGMAGSSSTEDRMTDRKWSQLRRWLRMERAAERNRARARLDDEVYSSADWSAAYSWVLDYMSWQLAKERRRRRKAR